MGMHLTLEKMIYGGTALGHHEGKAVFIEGGIAGEEVEVEILEEKTDFIVAKLARILESSPRRGEPRCPLFGQCGGCHWQHIDYPAQLHFKEQILAEQLKRIGGFERPEILPMIGMEQPWHYRHKARFGLRTVGDTVSLGFYKPGTRHPVEIEDCPILNNQINVVYRRLRDEFAYHLQPFKGFVTVEIRSSSEGTQILINTSIKYQQSLDSIVNSVKELAVVKGFHHRILRRHASLEYTTYFGDPFIVYTMGGLKFQVQPTSFFQVNLKQAKTLFAKAIEMMDIGGGSIVDAYCGVGVLTLMASRYADKVLGIEVAPSAIEDAKRNAELNGTNNATFREGLFQDLLPQLAEEVWEGVILDPPREGIVVKKALRRLIEFRPAKILYISCNPTTLARDCRLLCEGGYRLCRVQPIDMFPHTYHIEALALLDQK